MSPDYPEYYVHVYKKMLTKAGKRSIVLCNNPVKISEVRLIVGQQITFLKN